jgi:hypothetical protein
VRFSPDQRQCSSLILAPSRAPSFAPARESTVQLRLGSAGTRIERPTYVWLAIVLELFTAFGAIPVGIMFITDTSGATVGLQAGWIEATPFGTYLVPGLYLLLVNGFGMLVAAALSLMRHRVAPWLTGVLGAGLVIWILVELLLLPETMFLTWLFLAIGLVLGVISLVWLRRTGQLRFG